MTDKDAVPVYQSVPDDKLKSIANSYHPVGCYRLICDVLGEPFTTEECVRWLRRYTLETSSSIADVLSTLTEREQTTF